MKHRSVTTQHTWGTGQLQVG